MARMWPSSVFPSFFSWTLVSGDVHWVCGEKKGLHNELCFGNTKLRKDKEIYLFVLLSLVLQNFLVHSICLYASWIFKMRACYIVFSKHDGPCNHLIFSSPITCDPPNLTWHSFESSIEIMFRPNIFTGLLWEIWAL